MTKTDNPNGVKFKLNVRRTMLIGFAFFGILLLWQVYDSWCSTMLTDVLARNIYDLTSAELKDNALNKAKLLDVQWIVGIIMAVDNLAALILLPIFGSLSDKTNTKIGKRMPFILLGTFVAALAFPFIPLFYHYNNILGMVIMMAIVLLFMMMYRNPAVSLMPDITPKPLRARANGIINIIGYIGGACATVLGIFLKITDYLNPTSSVFHNIWTVELPFLIASVLMVISALVLFFTINENKVLEEVKEDIALGEKIAQVETPIDDNKPMSKANKIMLFAILGAEFLWFMSDNAIATFINNYVIYYLGCESSKTSTMVIIGGVGSVIGFGIAGGIAERIGRKWTVSIGLFLTVISLATMCFIIPSTKTYVNDKGVEFNQFPVMLFVIWLLKGFGMALVHNCSFPMVVELCSSKHIGKFTGHYYTASMLAQTITPVLLGLVFKFSEKWQSLSFYGLILSVLSALVFTICVKNVKAYKVKNVVGIEAIGQDD